MREETTSRYNDGKKKVVMKFIVKGESEEMIEKIKYSHNGDTLLWVKPLDNFMLKVEINPYGYGRVIKEFYSHGEKEKVIAYHDNKHLMRITHYKDDYKHGEQTRYHRNGLISLTGNYIYDDKDGEWIGYDEEGNIGYKENYKLGQYDGNCIYYNEERTIGKIGHYKNGYKDGKWIYYNEDGTLQKEKIYKDGKLIETKEY